MVILDGIMKQQGIRSNDFASKFYNKKKFSYVISEGTERSERTESDENRLSYCLTCNLLRPPRSFHCRICGFCVELHDHHCPWIGTCIGYRNLRYFLGFTFWTATHALIAALITLYVYFFKWEFFSWNNDS